jgi:type IV pilus assembly protein PilC
MAIFVWEGRTAQGRLVKGDNLEAPNFEAALARLREQRIRPIQSRVKEKGKGLEKEISIPGFGDKVTTKDLSLATRQLATMIDAGLPIVQCLDILAQQSESKLLCKTISTVKKNVEGGSTLADALRKHPKIFDDLYVNMVEAGEAGGILNTILNRIALFIEKANKLKKKVKGAMIYPVAIVCVAVIVVAVLMIFVIPVFAELYGGMGKALPLPTQVCIDISNWFVAYWYVLVAAIVGAFMGISFYYKTPQGHMNIDRLLLRMPIIGDLLRKVAVARF